MLEIGLERNPEPEYDRYIIAGCGHEVYEGEDVFQWEDGHTLCPDCIESKFDDMGTEEKAILLGCRWEIVH